MKIAAAASALPPHVYGPQQLTRYLESVFAMTFEGERGALGTIELGRTVDAERSAGPETVYAFYARSDRTRQRWAQVSPATGGDLADQLNQLIE